MNNKGVMMDKIVNLLEQLRFDAECQAQQLEAGSFKVYSVALDGAETNCTSARAKIFREIAAGLQRAIRLRRREETRSLSIALRGGTVKASK